jgi:ribonuclease-3
MPAADLQALEAKLGHSFLDRSLLVRALTHRSYVSGHGATDPSALDNERLEFLGDSILGFLLSEWLCQHYPTWTEGRLSKAKAHAVGANHLHGVAQRLELGGYLQLGPGEEKTGGRHKKALLVDALEAVIAALYLDAGLDVARAFVTREVLGGKNVEELIDDYKSALDQHSQGIGLPQPTYVVVEHTGPVHARTFTVEARVGDKYTGQGSGPSKKAAAQQAAKAILEGMGTSLRKARNVSDL